MRVPGKFGLIAIIAAIYYFNPLWVRSTTFRVATSVRDAIEMNHEVDPSSLKAAIANVTGDINQLTHLLQDFFARQPDDTMESSFKEFLQGKASRRHKDVEWFLDWLLGFYKFMWPFLVVYIVLRITGSKNEDDKGHERLTKPRKRIEGQLQANRLTRGESPSQSPRPDKFKESDLRDRAVAKISRAVSAESLG